MKLLLIIGGVLLTGIVAIIQYFDDEKKEKYTKENEKNLNAKIDTLQKSNSTLSHQLTETSLKLSETAIGAGDLKIGFSLVGTDEFRFIFTNDNPIPVYDAYITITNNKELLRCGIVKQDENYITFSLNCIGSLYEEMPLTINPGRSAVSSKNYKVESENFFTINLNTRKKAIVIQYALSYEDKIWVISYRIFDVINNKLVFVSKDPGEGQSRAFWEKYFFGNRTIAFL